MHLDSCAIRTKSPIRVILGGESVSIFRSQLLLDEQRLFFDIWRSACGNSQMPCRSEISPCQFFSLWPYVSLFEFENNDSMKVTVAGSGLRSVLGDEPKSVFQNKETEGGYQDILNVRKNATPICGVSHNMSSGRTGLVRFWMRLPLGNSSNVEEVIGLDLTLSSSRAPLWAIEQIKSSLAV